MSPDVASSRSQPTFTTFDTTQAFLSGPGTDAPKETNAEAAAGRHIALTRKQRNT